MKNNENGHEQDANKAKEEIKQLNDKLNKLDEKLNRILNFMKTSQNMNESDV